MTAAGAGYFESGGSAAMAMILERAIFAARIPILVFLAVMTFVAAYSAMQLRLDAGFEKALPVDHPYIKTYLDYREPLGGANRIVAVLETSEGTVWTEEFLARLKQVSDKIAELASGGEQGVTSMWTPSTRVYEITEEGFAGRNLIPAEIGPGNLSPEVIAAIRADAVRGGYMGYLIGKDEKSAMIFAEMKDIDPKTGARIDYFQIAESLETGVRQAFENGPYRVRIVGFAQMIASVADDAMNYAPWFFGVSVVLTLIAAYLFTQDIVLALLSAGCSLVSVIWMLGLVQAFGLAIDPIAILVPFLIFAIGVSHGVQQINQFSRDVLAGATSLNAARDAFRTLLAPGLGALATDMVGFATLMLIPVPALRDVALLAAIGIALKIVANLIALPLLASYVKLGPRYRARMVRERHFFHEVTRVIARVAHPPVAAAVFAGSLVVLAGAAWMSRSVPLGDLAPGVAELQPQSRYNVDSRYIADAYTLGLDLFIVVVEAPKEACVSYPYMRIVDELSWTLRNAPRVRSVASAPSMAKWLNAAWNEGNPKFYGLPRNADALAQALGPIPVSAGLFDADCRMLPVHVFMQDSTDASLSGIVAAAKAWRAAHAPALALSPASAPRLGTGNTREDECWSARDRRDGTWNLSPADLTDIAYTPQRTPAPGATVTLSAFPGGVASASVLSEAADALGLNGRVCQDAPHAPKGEAEEKPLWTLDIPLPEGTPGEPIALDILGALKTANLSPAGAGRFELSGLPESVHVRLAGGNAGVNAAINEAVKASEYPALVVVYALVVVIVFVTYRDWRAALCCLVPLTLATFLGYAFMVETGMGLKLSTLPVLVLTVGLGVDYGFYIYSRFEHHLRTNHSPTHAYQRALAETGVAVIFTAVTLTIGVATWIFSPLRLQSDMGALMTFMLIANMVAAVSVLPAWAVMLDRVLPRPRTNGNGDAHAHHAATGRH